MMIRGTAEGWQVDRELADGGRLEKCGRNCQKGSEGQRIQQETSNLSEESATSTACYAGAQRERANEV